MFAGAVALGFRKYGASVTEPERVGDNLYKFSILYKGKNKNVYVVLGSSSTDAVDGIIVPLGTNVKGNNKVLDTDKVNTLLRRIGITIDDILEVLSVGGYFIAPKKSPSSYFTLALDYASDYNIIFNIPLSFPVLHVTLEYKTVVRKFFSKKVVNVRGTTIINPFTLSYCTWSEKGLLCDDVVRTLTPQIYELIPVLRRIENSKVTPEAVASKMKIRIDRVEKILMEAEKTGFAIPLARNVYKITKLTPRFSKQPKLKLEKDIPLAWSYFPYTCLERRVRYREVKKFLETVVNGKVLDAKYLFMPYIILGGMKHGKRAIIAYNVIFKSVDETLSELLSNHFNCLYLLSR